MIILYILVGYLVFYLISRLTIGFLLETYDLRFSAVTEDEILLIPLAGEVVFIATSCMALLDVFSEKLGTSSISPLNVGRKISKFLTSKQKE